MKTLHIIPAAILTICAGSLSFQACSQDSEYEEWKDAEYPTASNAITRSAEPQPNDPIEDTKIILAEDNKGITINSNGVEFHVNVGWRQTTTDSMCDEDITKHEVSSWQSYNDIQLAIHSCNASWHNKTALTVTISFDILYPLENPMTGDITWTVTPASSNLSASKQISILSYLSDM